MAWVTVNAKDAAGNLISIKGQASDVLLSDDRTAEAVLTTIAAQAAALNTNIQTLTTTIDSILGEGE